MGQNKRWVARRMYLPDEYQKEQGMDFAYHSIHHHSSTMGDNGLHLRTGYQQFDDHQLSFFTRSNYTHYSNAGELKKAMAEINLWKWIITIVGLPTYFGAIWLNIQNNSDNWKANILFILGGVFLIARIIVYVIKARQDIRLREWEFEQKTKEKKVDQTS